MDKLLMTKMQGRKIVSLIKNNVMMAYVGVEVQITLS
jgi:hypothetical protein